MVSQALDEMVWHNDGHIMHLQIQKHELVITHVTCPGGDDAPCTHEQVNCVVEHFIRMYGLDCNVGIAYPSASMKIAWSKTGNTYDLDTTQVWIIPTDDEAFAAWIEMWDAELPDGHPESDDQNGGSSE